MSVQSQRARSSFFSFTSGPQLCRCVGKPDFGVRMGLGMWIFQFKPLTRTPILFLSAPRKTLWRFLLSHSCTTIGLLEQFVVTIESSPLHTYTFIGLHWSATEKRARLNISFSLLQKRSCACVWVSVNSDRELSILYWWLRKIFLSRSHSF